MKKYSVLIFAILLSSSISFADMRESSNTSSSALTIQTTSGPQGTYLTDSKGMALYMFEADSPGKSSCYEDCAKKWPPLFTQQAENPQVSGEAKSSEISVISREDGQKQVAYHGMPLYYYYKDQKAGDITGEGINDSGGVWHLVKPSGVAFGS